MMESGVCNNYSVLMSVYEKDQPAYLNKAIASMSAQTIPFVDIVIVCDGPLTDELYSELLHWKNELKDSITVIQLPENVGLGAALNEGLKYCQCDLVARMDSDDISRINRCELLLAAINEADLDLVGGAIEEFDNVPGDLGVFRKMPESQEEILKFAARRNPFNHMTVMFNKEKVLDAGGYEPFYLMEDYWLWARMLSSGCRCANVPEVVVDARVGAGMYARRTGIDYLKSQISFFRQLKELGLANSADCFVTISARFVTSILPTEPLKAIYKKYLRN